MLEPKNYVNGGSGQLKFVAQLLKDKSGVQPVKSFADMVCGHPVQVRGNYQPNLLNAHEKRKMQNRGEKQNSVIDHRRVSDTTVSIPGPMNLGGRDGVPRHCGVELTLGETNSAGNRRSFPLNFKSKTVFGKECELRNTQWTRGGLIIEVNKEGKRSVIWNAYKGDLRTSNWVSRSWWEQEVGPPTGSWVLIKPILGLAHSRCVAGTSNKGDGRTSKWVKRNLRNFAPQAQVKPVMGLDPRCDTLVGLPHVLNSKSIGPVRFEVGESSSLSDPRPLTLEAHESVMIASSNIDHNISDSQTEVLGRLAELVREVDDSVSGGFHAEESPTTPSKADTVLTHSWVTATNSVYVHEVAAPQAETMGRPRNSNMEVESLFSEGYCADEPPMTGFDISKMLGRPAELVREVGGSVSGGFHVEELLMTSGKADIVLIHSLGMGSSFGCVHEVTAPQAEAMGRLENSFMEVDCPLSVGYRAGELPMTLGRVNTESVRVSMGLFLFNLFLSLSRAGITELGVQGGDKGGWVDFAKVAQELEIPNQVDQLVVSADSGYPEVRVSTAREVVSADLGLGDVDSPSPLMTITPLGLAEPVELISGDEVLGIENSLNISNWVKLRLPGFSKMMGLSLGRHEEKCIKLLQGLEREIEATNLLKKKAAAHRKATSKDKGKRELRNLISSVNYDCR